MSHSQRLMFLATAAVLAVVAIFVLADSSEDDPVPSTATATATPTATVPQAAAPRSVPLLTTAEVAEIGYTEGDTVRLRVRSREPDRVHVRGYDLFEDVVPGRTTLISFEADITGVFEVELADSGKDLARLTVEPE